MNVVTAAQTLAQSSSVGVFEDINIKDKSTATMEILIMLLGAVLLGVLAYWLYHRFVHTEAESAPAPRPRPKAPAAVAPVAATPVRRAVSSKPDDLTMVEGIGPKINELLQAGGIRTFENLADSSAPKIKAILEEAGPRFRNHEPRTWPQQARLAADGKFAELEELQDRLDGGK